MPAVRFVNTAIILLANLFFLSGSVGEDDSLLTRRDSYILIKGHSVSWSGDEQFAVFDSTYEPRGSLFEAPIHIIPELQRGKRGLFIATVSTGKVARIRLPGWDCRDPAYCRFSNTIGFMARDSEHAGLWIVDQGGGGKRQVVRSVDVARFEWVGATRRIAYLISSETKAEDAVHVIDVHTMEFKTLIRLRRHRKDERAIASFAVCRSGKNIALTLPIWKADNLWLSKVEEVSWTKVKTQKSWGARCPQWLGDDGNVIFSMAGSRTKEGEIISMLEEYDRGLRSPTGSYPAEFFGQTLWIASFEDPIPRHFRIVANTWRPVPSSDGRKIAFDSTVSEGIVAACIWDSEKKEIVNLTPDLSNCHVLGWSPDDNWIMVREPGRGVRCYEAAAVEEQKD